MTRRSVLALAVALGACTYGPSPADVQAYDAAMQVLRPEVEAQPGVSKIYSLGTDATAPSSQAGLISIRLGFEGVDEEEAVAVLDTVGELVWLGLDLPINRIVLTGRLEETGYDVQGSPHPAGLITPDEAQARWGPR